MQGIKTNSVQIYAVIRILNCESHHDKLLQKTAIQIFQAKSKLNGKLMHWSIDALIDWCINWLMHWLIDTLIDWYIDWLMHCLALWRAERWEDTEFYASHILANCPAVSLSYFLLCIFLWNTAYIIIIKISGLKNALN